MTVPQVAARRVPLAVAACAARRAAQFRLRQCNAMQVRSPSRLDRDYEYIPVTWGIKIAEFLVEMELFPHSPKSNEGGKPFKMSILMSVAFDAKTKHKKPS